MKKHTIYSKLYSLVFLTLFFSNISKGTDLDIVITVGTYNGGANLTCHGAQDGYMEAVIVGGIAPYSFQWTNGSFIAYTKKITGLAPGEYIFTVIDGNQDTVSKSAKVYDVDPLSGSLELSLYAGGYNISSQGGEDGDIHINISGGTPEYFFLWSTGYQEQNIGGLTAGTYSVTITDQNECSLTLTATLTEPTPLHVTSITSPLHHGYNVSCNGSENGSVDLSVSGGVPPYTYLWNSGDTTQDLDSLKAGTYTVQIEDANKVHISRSITLTQPAALDFNLSPTVYSNGKNTSCFNCSDGYISTTVTGGAGTLTYLWNTGQTTANLSGVIARNYILYVTDANGCQANKEITLSQPDRDDWTVQGNSGTSPDSNYIGTNDNKDFTLRTNHVERIRIQNSGNVGIGTSQIPGGYKLAVNGKIICEEVKVKLYTTWPDFVFKPDYRLMPLKELKSFIAVNKHLPEIPSADEVEKQGNSLGELQAKLLQKIEELTLYLVQQNEKIEKLQSDNAALSSKLDEISGQVKK